MLFNQRTTRQRNAAMHGERCLSTGVWMVLALTLTTNIGWSADTKTRAAESAYAEKWESIAELLRRREFSNAAATLEKLAEDSKLEYARPIIEADKEVVAGLQTLTRIVFEEAAKLKADAPLSVASIEYTFVEYRENPKGDELVLKSKATGRNTTRSISGLPATTWLQLAGDRKSDITHPPLVFGVFVGFDQVADVKAARKFFDEAASEGVNVTHWLSRLEQPEKPRTTEKDDAPTIVATWAHQVMKDRKVIRRQIVKLYSNGRINAPFAGATWSQRGNILILNWPSPEAPGGKWVDVLTLSANGKAYAGKNQDGFLLTGVLLGKGEANAD